MGNAVLAHINSQPPESLRTRRTNVLRRQDAVRKSDRMTMHYSAPDIARDGSIAVAPISTARFASSTDIRPYIANGPPHSVDEVFHLAVDVRSDRRATKTGRWWRASRSKGIDVLFEEVRDAHNWENRRDRLRSGLSWPFPAPSWLVYE